MNPALHRCRSIALALSVAVLAGCGSSSKSVVTTTAPSKPGPGRVLYQSGGWAVTVSGSHARAQHLVGGAWQTDRRGQVKISILGPHGTAPATPQVAVELTAQAPLVESGLWVDGTELLVKGGGLTPKRGTIYGAPGQPLAPGRHVAVAYARTTVHATAVAWTFVSG